LILALGPERVYVFGSQARADARPDSDIDLLVVVPGTSASQFQLTQTAYRAAHLHSLDADILLMPREEFARRSQARASLPATVLREGRLLYEVA
jgi:predicted nucleotidyltransferase